MTLEVEQQLSPTEVRCIALGPTDGMERGMVATDTGAPITVPVGPTTLGRVFNVVGDVIDEGKPIESKFSVQFTEKHRCSLIRKQSR